MALKFSVAVLLLFFCLITSVSTAFAEAESAPWTSSTLSKTNDLTEQGTAIGECSLGESSSPSCGFLGEESEEASRVVSLDRNGKAPTGYELVEFDVSCQEQGMKKFSAGTVVRVGAEYKVSRGGQAKRSILVEKASLVKVDRKVCLQSAEAKSGVVLSVLLSQKDERQLKVIRGVATLFLEPA